MLQQFTWSQFLIAALLLSIIWYAGVVLIFYQKEFFALLIGRKNGKPKIEPLPHTWEKEEGFTADENVSALLGESKLPEGMSTVSMSGFGFSRGEGAKEHQVGLVPDVLEEIKMVFDTLTKEDGNKNNFLNLMRLLSDKYPKIGSNPNIGYINEFITDHAPFHLSAEELEDLWI
ncbi:hypothetical protein ABIB40_003877 [Pedobacter sp. UYP30]|uniref:hypothetical protein n=1 Tax=Pedobacter sp. UYP30 TaxID=1756400 RepID=UPI003391BB5A